MGRLLPLLILFLAICAPSSHAASTWATCIGGEAPKVRNPQGGPAALNSLMPAGDYWPGEMSQTIDAFDSGHTTTCIAPNTWQPMTCSQNDSNNTYSCQKICKRPVGTTAATAYATGSQICGAYNCPYAIGSMYPGSASALNFCHDACEVEVRNYGITTTCWGDDSGDGENAICEPSPSLYSVVVGHNCQLSKYARISTDNECITTGNGYELCRTPGESHQFCGTINGQPYCLPTIMSNPPCSGGTCGTPENPVVTLPDGSQLAPTGTPTPPAPDNGTAGSPAPSDLTLQGTGSDGNPGSYDYWSPSTVAGSTGGNPGGGDGDGDGDGTGGGTPGVTCGGPDQPNCKFELQGSFDGPEREGVPTFTEAAQTFQSSLQDAPIIQAVSNLAGSIPEGGTPPSGQVTLDALGGVTLTLAPPPEVIAEIAPVLSIVMLLAWALIAIFIFMSA